jgi:hypothetical protein
MTIIGMCRNNEAREREDNVNEGQVTSCARCAATTPALPEVFPEQKEHAIYVEAQQVRIPVTITGMYGKTLYASGNYLEEQWSSWERGWRGIDSNVPTNAISRTLEIPLIANRSRMCIYEDFDKVLNLEIRIGGCIVSRCTGDTGAYQNASPPIMEFCFSTAIYDQGLSCYPTKANTLVVNGTLLGYVITPRGVCFPNESSTFPESPDYDTSDDDMVMFNFTKLILAEYWVCDDDDGEIPVNI